MANTKNDSVSAADLMIIKQQLAALQAENEKLRNNNGGPKGPQRVIKTNSVGGLFVRDPSFRAYSEKKGKAYTAGLNVPKEVAVRLFTDDSLLKEVCDYVRNNMAA